MIALAMPNELPCLQCVTLVTRCPVKQHSSDGAQMLVALKLDGRLGAFEFRYTSVLRAANGDTLPE